MGIGSFSLGDAVNWFGGGKTDVTAQNHVTVTYGTSTALTVGLASTFAVGMSTAITVGGQVNATLSSSYSIAKGVSLTDSPDGSFYYENSYVGSVGASVEQASAAKVLRRATYVLLGTQTAAMAACAATATTFAIQDTDRDSVTLTKGGMPIELTMRIAQIGMLITPMLLIFFNKRRKLGTGDSPAAVLTMNANSGVFLGRRQSTGTASSGIVVNDTHVQLSAARTDLKYDKPTGSATVVGFSRKAGNTGIGGARLEVRNTGSTTIFGTSLQANLFSANATSRHTIHAQEHALNVTTPHSLTPAGPALRLSSASSELAFDAQTSAMLATNSVTLKAGGAPGSVLKLAADASTMGTGGNNITINPTSVILGFGNTKLIMNATGLTIGDAITVLNPGPPGVTYGALQQAIADVTKLKSAATVTAQGINALEAQYQAQVTATDLLQKQLIAAQAAVDELTEQIKPK